MKGGVQQNSDRHSLLIAQLGLNNASVGAGKQRMEMADQAQHVFKIYITRLQFANG